MNKDNLMYVFREELEKNIQLYSIICSTIFPGTYVNQRILECLQSPNENGYLAKKLVETYQNLPPSLKIELENICSKIGFVLNEKENS